MKGIQHTYYKKVGRKYVPVQYFEPEGYPEGLWLFYHKPGAKTVTNALYYTKVHDIQNLGTFCDLQVNFGEELQNKISVAIDEWIKEKGSYSIADLTTIVLTVLSNELNNGNSTLPT